MTSSHCAEVLRVLYCVMGRWRLNLRREHDGLRQPSCDQASFIGSLSTWPRKAPRVLVSASETTIVGEGTIGGRVWKCNQGGGKQDIRWKGGSGFSEHLPRAHTFVMFPVRRKPTEPLAVWGQLACLRLVTSQLYWCIGGGTEHLSGVN